MPKPFTLRDEVDFIAIAPVLLGFQPEESLVMITLNSFHARVDIPEPDEAGDCIGALLGPCKQHHVSQVAFVLFASDDHPRFMTQLVDSFEREDVQVMAALEVRGNQWRRFGAAAWIDYDFTAHPLLLEAKFRDLAPKHATRAEMAEQIKPRGTGHEEYQLTALRRLHEDGADRTIEALRRETSKEAVELWQSILVACEPGTQAAADSAIVLAFAAWLSGDGAKAWTALDLTDRSSPLWLIMYGLLSKAVNPSVWPHGATS